MQMRNRVSWEGSLFNSENEVLCGVPEHICSKTKAVFSACVFWYVCILVHYVCVCVLCVCVCVSLCMCEHMFLCVCVCVYVLVFVCSMCVLMCEVILFVSLALKVVLFGLKHHF